MISMHLTISLCWLLLDNYESEVKVSHSVMSDPMNYTVRRILQARIIEWVAYTSSSRSSRPRKWTGVSCIAGRFFTTWAIIMGEVKYVCMGAQSCPTLCSPTDCSPPVSSVQGILQARILEWVAISHFRGSSQDWTCISCVSCRNMIHQHDHRGFVTAPGIPIAHKIKEIHGPQTDASLSSHKLGSLDMTTPGVILATPVSNNWSRFPSWAPTLRSKPRTGHRRAWETHRPAGAQDTCNWTVGISESENNTCTPCQVDPLNTLVDH